MTTETTTLTDFLLARIAEDEAGARAAMEESPTPWVDDGGTLDDAERRSIAGYAGRFTSPYIAAWDPARVLAECEAKRRIVAAHAEAWTAPWTDDSVQRRYAARGRTAGLYEALRDLALPYADQPDFRAEWRA